MKERLQNRAPLSRRILSYSSKPVLITGGAGFIGTNVATRLLSEGQPVLIFDNLSRSGVEGNLEWLRDRFGSLLEIEIEDVRHDSALRRAVNRSSRVIHLSAQVAVTTSLMDPVLDFEINVHGTLNLLEALRSMADPPPLDCTSTNKVYGALDDVPLSESETRYEPVNPDLRYSGIDETRTLDFHSPYGCSKGTADQYILDYARSFGISVVVFRVK